MSLEAQYESRYETAGNKDTTSSLYLSVDMTDYQVLKQSKDSKSSGSDSLSKLTIDALTTPPKNTREMELQFPSGQAKIQTDNHGKVTKLTDQYGTTYIRMGDSNEWMEFGKNPNPKFFKGNFEIVKEPPGLKITDEERGTKTSYFTSGLSRVEHADKSAVLYAKNGFEVISLIDRTGTSWQANKDGTWLRTDKAGKKSIYQGQISVDAGGITWNDKNGMLSRDFFDGRTMFIGGGKIPGS